MGGSRWLRGAGRAEEWRGRAAGRAARPLRGPGGGAERAGMERGPGGEAERAGSRDGDGAGRSGSGRSRTWRSRRGWGRNFLRGYGSQTPLRGPSLGRGLLADGREMTLEPRSGRRVKHLYSDSRWKCLFSRLDMDLGVIRLALRCCPAVKARSRSAERRGGR